MSFHLRHIDLDRHETRLEARDRLAEHGSVPPEQIDPFYVESVIPPGVTCDEWRRRNERKVRAS